MASVRRVCQVICIVFTLILLAIGGILLAATIRALMLEDTDYQYSAYEGGLIDDIPASYLETLPQIFADALKIPTVSKEPGDYDREQLLKFHQFLRDNFPNVFNSSFIKVEVINTYSLLFTIMGSDENVQPYLLASHMDVVPVDENKWSNPPFSGRIMHDPDIGELYIWGRGAIDDKSGVMGIMMALEYLVISGFQPKRKFYVAFGHDEEVNGYDGAYHISKTLLARNVTLDFLLDEGMPILEGVIKGMDVPVAVIGVTEKGWMRVKVEVEGEGGHSSIPPKDQVVTRLSKAIYNLGRYPQPSMFGTGPESDLFNYLAPKASWPYKLVFANLWLFRPLLEMVMSASRETNAFLRTTTAATIVRAGVKENVVPTSGYAIVNHRVHPAQSLEDVLQHDIDIIGDAKVKVSVDQQRAAHPVSPYGPKVPGWRLIASTLQHFFPKVVAAPGMLVANTDTIHYLNLTSCVYRFMPIFLDNTLIYTIHTHNERLPVSAVINEVRYYHRLILSADVDVPPIEDIRPGHRSGEL
ncbi:hypothetical protein SK128_020072 [Halocaridina rubra]|uniref:Peptidase M20 dimerisation domain-containing protein n=1 Tax=Halocaridina rubra TaxID=373956 RepID=A0AAN8X2E9_HALRR